MKRLFLALLILSIAIPAGAASLAWDHNTDTINGYRVYIDDMDTPVGSVTPDQNTYPLPEMVIGQEYLVGVSAYNQAGESAKALIRFTYQEDIEIVLPQQPVQINIDFK
jgi:hypothetical protein